MKGICLIWSNGRQFSPSLPDRAFLRMRKFYEVLIIMKKCNKENEGDKPGRFQGLRGFSSKSRKPLCHEAVNMFVSLQCLPMKIPLMEGWESLCNNTSNNKPLWFHTVYHKPADWLASECINKYNSTTPQLRQHWRLCQEKSVFETTNKQWVTLYRPIIGLNNV